MSAEVERAALAGWTADATARTVGLFGWWRAAGRAAAAYAGRAAGALTWTPVDADAARWDGPTDRDGAGRIERRWDEPAGTWAGRARGGAFWDGVH